MHDTPHSNEFGESFTEMIEGIAGSFGAPVMSSPPDQGLATSGVGQMVEHPDWDCSRVYLSCVFETLCKKCANRVQVRDQTDPQAKEQENGEAPMRVGKAELLRVLKEGTELDLLAVCLEGGKARLLGCLRTHPAMLDPQSEAEPSCGVSTEAFVEAVQDIAASFMEETGRLELCLCSDYNQAQPARTHAPFSCKPPALFCQPFL
jgi:hypothetical protein